MIYSNKQKEYFIYKEYDDEFGYKEKINVSSVFETIDDLIKCIEGRKMFYGGNTRKIEIECIHGENFYEENKCIK